MLRFFGRVIRRTWRPVAVLLATAAVLFIVFSLQTQRDAQIKAFVKAFANQKQTVSTTVAASQPWQAQIDAVGSLRAVNGADLALEVAGIVDTINFKSGDDVQANAVLLHLRSDDDEARLHSLEAVAELAQVTLDRDQKQFKAQAVSQATIDADAANLKNDKAQVVQQKAILDKKTLRAPFTGHIGIRSVDLGQYLAAGTTVVTLQQLDPIYCDFFLPQQTLEQIKIGQKVDMSVDAFPAGRFTGRIDAINPKVDTATRNVQVRAAIANADHKLLPGMFASIHIDTGTPQTYVTLPQTAIAFNPYGSTVFLVDDKGKDAKGQEQLVARQTFVTTGPTRGDLIAVLKGVKDGDTVVTAGQIKLHNGTPVAIDNKVQPAAEANPTTIDQ